MKSYKFENMVVFDLETTGCSPTDNKIIEIGAIKIRDGKIVDEFSQLVDPEIPIPYFITEITGIDMEMVLGKPTIKEVLPQFLDFCEGSYILGHNISFDYRFIKANCVKLNYSFEKDAFDTLTLARKFLKRLPSRSLGPLCEYYKIDLSNAHRASHDARATYELFLKLKEQFYDQNPSSFVPKKMAWKPPKNSMITERQKRYLASLVKTYDICLEKDIEAFTKSEASRMIDKILHEERKAW